MEAVDSPEELKSSRSASGKNFPNFEMLDAKIASALSRGTESPERGPVSTRKTDSLLDL